MVNPLPVEKIIEQLRSFFSSREDVVAVYLFGSHAKGTQNEHSDVDIAVLFERLKVPSLQDYLKLVAELSTLLRKETDVIILNNADTVLKCQIFKHGVIVFERDRIASRRFVAQGIMEYIDLSYNRSIAEKAMYKRLEGGENPSNARR